MRQMSIEPKQDFTFASIASFSSASKVLFFSTIKRVTRKRQ